jgi:hypothetical protein
MLDDARMKQMMSAAKTAMDAHKNGLDRVRLEALKALASLALELRDDARQHMEFALTPDEVPDKR